MLQPEMMRTIDLVEQASPKSEAGHTPTLSEVANHSGPPRYFEEALQDAERLLKYAAEVGIDVDSDVRDDVLRARSGRNQGWSDQTAANLLAALTKLAARVRPVTAESLHACIQQEQHTVHVYVTVAICLVLLIVPCSVFSFVTSAIADAIRKDIVTANELAVKLTAQLPLQSTATSAAGTAANRLGDTPAASIDVVSELQQFAATIRFVDTRASRLNVLMRSPELDRLAPDRPFPEKMEVLFQLPVGIPDPPGTAANLIKTFQERRLFAQTVLDDLSYFYGAITSCILPMLYALLGTCAYLARSFEDHMQSKTFTPSATNGARFLIAAIGGAVVGLFNNFSIVQEASISPLAIAFLVGYGVDVFFSFLDGLLQAFTKNKGMPASASGGKA